VTRLKAGIVQRPLEQVLLDRARQRDQPDLVHDVDLEARVDAIHAAGHHRTICGPSHEIQVRAR
jgi:hypothetical protein